MFYEWLITYNHQSVNQLCNRVKMGDSLRRTSIALPPLATKIPQILPLWSPRVDCPELECTTHQSGFASILWWPKHKYTNTQIHQYMTENTNKYNNRPGCLELQCTTHQNYHIGSAGDPCTSIQTHTKVDNTQRHKNKNLKPKCSSIFWWPTFCPFPFPQTGINSNWFSSF